MPAALAQVKQAFGAEAVILHTRAYKRGGILGFGARTIIEITAARGSDIGQARKPRRPAGQAAGSTTAVAPRDDDPRESMPAGELIRRTYLAAQAELKQSNAAAPNRLGGAQSNAAAPSRQGGALHAGGGPVVPPDRDGAPTAVAVVGDDSGIPRYRPLPKDELADEMRMVKRMVAKMARQQKEQAATVGRGKGKAAPDIPDKLFDQYLTLLQQEVTEDLAEEVIAQVRAALKPEDLDNAGVVRQAVCSAIAKLVPVEDAGSVKPRSPDGRPRTVALIGPTGVGKTTTIAKLAASFKLRERKQVGLITIDTYRIAAVDQLRTYANIIGVPLHVVASPADMRDAIGRCAGCDVILIDTAGRSQRDDPKLEQLSEYLAAASPHEVHLVLSSTCSQATLLDVVERFSQIRVDHMIFTKLDEAVTFGVILNVARKVNKRLSYMTTGQEVPHDIEVSRSDRLAALVLGEGL
jgi:flagellar biosynthesis protein FlhF